MEIEVPAVLRDSQVHGIPVFPSRWSDLNWVGQLPSEELQALFRLEPRSAA